MTPIKQLRNNPLEQEENAIEKEQNEEITITPFITKGAPKTNSRLRGDRHTKTANQHF